MAALGEIARAACNKRPSRTELARVGGTFRWPDGGSVADQQSGWEWSRSQPCQGATELGFPGPTLGQMQSEAAGRAGVSIFMVIRPAIEKKRRRRVLVVTTCWPRPMRAVQRARLWAITWMASQAPLAGKRPDGRWLSPTPYLRSRMAFSISAWRRWSASSARVSPSRSVMQP